jgi:hypothetical protein
MKGFEKNENQSGRTDRIRYLFPVVQKLRGVCTWITSNRQDIAVVAGWAVANALVTIKTYWFFYLESEMARAQKFAYSSYKAPLLGELDWLVLFCAGLIATLILADIRKVLFGYMISIPISFFTVISFFSYFIWYALGLGQFLSRIRFGWEWAVLLAIYNLARMVPHLIFFSVLGIVLGSILKSWLP